VFPGLLAALFREPPQQLLVDVAHLQRREPVRPEFQFLVLIEDGGQAIVLHHLSDGGPVVDVLDDVVDVLGKPVDVRAEILFEQRMVFLVDAAQRRFRLVRERASTPAERANVEKFVTVHGEELSPTNYAICQADLLIKNDQQAKVHLGNSLVPHDAHSKEPGDQFPESKFRFDFMLSNPPFGVTWGGKDGYETEAQA
jgi:hypothetical protein